MQNPSPRLGAPGLALLTLLVCIGAAVLVPPSRLDPEISDLERSLAAVITPLLILACAFALGAVATAFAGQARLAGLLGILGLLAVPVAAMLSAQYGAPGASIPMALVVAAPLAAAFAARESAWRRSRGSSGS